MGKRFGKSANVGIGVGSNLLIIDQSKEMKMKVKTRTIRISEDLYQSLKQHANRYYNRDSYEVILSDLLDCYQKHNNTYWYHNLDR
jgi:hypothetical protein